MASVLDKFDLSGKCALVTGASSGLGWRMAEVLAEQGARVVLGARRADRLEQLKASIERAGGTPETVALDVSERDSIVAAIDRTRDLFGPLDILINNAGVAIEKWAIDVTPDDWRRVLNINLDGVWHGAQAAARQMIEAGNGGVIINIASILGLGVSKITAPYAVSKAGVVQLTKALALEFARHDIRVNAIAPGYIRTEINEHFLDSEDGKRMLRKIPQRRFGEPSDLDGVLLLLASSASSFMTGAVLTVDGGQLLDVG